MHPREIYTHETPAHHRFGGSLAQTVVALSRSEFENIRVFALVVGWSRPPHAPHRRSAGDPLHCNFSVDKLCGLGVVVDPCSEATYFLEVKLTVLWTHEGYILRSRCIFRWLDSSQGTISAASALASPDSTDRIMLQ